MKDALQNTAELNKRRWIKIPQGTWKFFLECGYTPNEIGVLLFFYEKLCSLPEEDSTLVVASNKDIMDATQVSRRVYFRAITKMTMNGMVRHTSNTWELKGLLDTMDRRAEIILKGVEWNDCQ